MCLSLISILYMVYNSRTSHNAWHQVVQILDALKGSCTEGGVWLLWHPLISEPHSQHCLLQSHWLHPSQLNSKLSYTPWDTKGSFEWSILDGHVLHLLTQLNHLTQLHLWFWVMILFRFVIDFNHLTSSNCHLMIHMGHNFTIPILEPVHGIFNLQLLNWIQHLLQCKWCMAFDRSISASKSCRRSEDATSGVGSWEICITESWPIGHLKMGMVRWSRPSSAFLTLFSASIMILRTGSQSVAV